MEQQSINISEARFALQNTRGLGGRKQMEGAGYALPEEVA